MPTQGSEDSHDSDSESVLVEDFTSLRLDEPVSGSSAASDAAHTPAADTEPPRGFRRGSPLDRAKSAAGGAAAPVVSEPRAANEEHPGPRVSGAYSRPRARPVSPVRRYAVWSTGTGGREYRGVHSGIGTRAYFRLRELGVKYDFKRAQPPYDSLRDATELFQSRAPGESVRFFQW
jgi:hypothetical protein